MIHASITKGYLLDTNTRDSGRYLLHISFRPHTFFSGHYRHYCSLLISYSACVKTAYVDYTQQTAEQLKNVFFSTYSQMLFSSFLRRERGLSSPEPERFCSRQNHDCYNGETWERVCDEKLFMQPTVALVLLISTTLTHLLSLSKWQSPQRLY